MSKAEIFEAISKLTKEGRHEIRTHLAEMDGDGWLEAALWYEAEREEGPWFGAGP